MNASMDRDIKIVWDYMKLGEPSHGADALVVLGCRDDRVAYTAAELVKQYDFKVVIVSGGAAPHNPHLKNWSEMTEARHFVATMAQQGIDIDQVLVEDKAVNTGENAQFVYKMLINAGFEKVSSIVLVTKPYMERRAVATFEAQWPRKGVGFSAFSAPRDIATYCNEEYGLVETAKVMIKDFYNLSTYAERGWSTPQHIPSAVATAAHNVKAWLDDTNVVLKASL